MSEIKKDLKVLIVGAGPSGLLLALLLGQKGIESTILEKSHEIDRNPRASFYAYPTIRELRRAGLMEDIMKDAFVPSGVTWRLLDGTPIAKIHPSNEVGRETMVSLPLDELLPIMNTHLQKCERSKLLLNHEVVAIGQDEDKAWATVQTPEGEKRFEGDYIVGCDGGNSKIRRELFGGEFPGFTWDKQIVATNVYYPKFKDFKWTSSNFLIDKDHFTMIAQIAKDGLLRVTYGEEGGLTREEMHERLAWKYKTILPGAPEPGEYDVKSFSPYRIHQRCAEKLRVGRFLLTADAAHLCNPFGGLGLTGGLVDVGNLFDCLYGIATGEVDEDILDKYSEIRMQKFHEVISPISSGNIRRLWDPSPEAIANEPFFNAVKEAEQNEHLAQQMKTGLNVVMHDFTQYYRSRAVA